MKWIMTGLLFLGGLLCCQNFYLSVLRYPFYRMTGGRKEDYRWVSGIPVFGSLFVAIALFQFWQSPWLVAAAIVLILIDTGGLHWFLVVMLWQAVCKKGNRPTPEPPYVANRAVGTPDRWLHEDDD